MKLRNKKTGEIGEIGYIGSSSGELTVSPINRVACESIASYNSIAELEREWEDYEEPKEYWFIENDGYINSIGVDEDLAESLRASKEIGNYFETEEEAEKAVEKLKAWKRLKDKGFRFVEGWLDINHDFIIKAKLGTVGLIDQPDVNLLFGGKE